jgi:PAS domain S-box-containing protein
MKPSSKKESDEQTAQHENLGINIPDSVIYRAYIDQDGQPQLNYLSNSIGKFADETGASLLQDHTRFLDMIHEEDKEYYFAERSKAIQNITDLNIEVRLRTGTGEIAWINNRARPKKMANGSFVWEGFLIDITGKKKAEEALKISEEKFRSCVENSNAVFYTMTLNGTFTFITDNCKELFGHEGINVIGVCAFEGFVHKSDIALCKAHIDKLISTGKKLDAIEYRVWHGDGKWIWISTSVSPIFDKKGNIHSLQGIALEITERKKAEDALTKSEERFRSFVENANDTVFSLTPEGTLLYASPNWTNVLGHDVSDFIGKSVFETLIHPDDIPSCIEAIIRGVVTGEKQSGIQYRASHKDGSWRWQTTNASPFFDNKGRVVSFLGIARDITEQKAAEEALKKSESLFRSLVENANDIIYTLTLYGILTYASPNASRLLGHDVNIYIGQSVFDAFLHPDDFNQCRAFMHHVFTTGKKQSGIEHRIKCQDNTWRTFLTNASPLFDQHKNIVSFLGLARDITEQKTAVEALAESEQSYHGLFNTVTEAIYIQDKNGCFIDVNSGVEKMYGYTKEELLEKTPADLAAPGKNNMEHIAALINETFTTGKAQQIDFWGIRKNGEIFPKEVICNKGKYMGNDVIITTARDISERKKAEALIRESNERWQFALEGAGDGIWDLNTATNKAFYSHNWKAMLGYTDDEIADSIDEWENRIHPADRDGVTEQVKKYQHNLLPAYECEYRMLCKDGSYKWILGRGKVTPGTEPGKPLRFIGIHTDITERKIAENQIKESKEKFSKIFHLSPDLIFLTRLSDGVVVDVNSRAFQLSGYHRSELIGKTSLDVKAWDDMQMRDQFIAELLKMAG